MCIAPITKKNAHKIKQKDKRQGTDLTVPAIFECWFKANFNL